MRQIADPASSETPMRVQRMQTSTVPTTAVDAERGSRRLHIPAVSVPERVHDDDHLVLWQARGSAEAVLDGVDHPLSAGQALWVPAGTRHVLHVHANSVMLPMFFEVEGPATMLRGIATVRVDRELRTLFLSYIQSQQTIIRPDVDIARQILSMIERQPMLATALPLPVSEAAAAVAEILRFNPGDGRRAEELALQAHASLRTVEREFKAETGMTLREWRIQNRMERAAELLRSARSADAVAHRVGYTDVSAFRRVFKARFGMTPGEYVDRYRSV